MGYQAAAGYPIFLGEKQFLIGESIKTEGKVQLLDVNSKNISLKINYVTSIP
jgi:hypothetical protein